MTPEKLHELAAINADLLEALREMEAANDALCAKRSQDTYLSMLDIDKCGDELEALDDARRKARAAIARAKGVSRG